MDTTTSIILRQYFAGPLELVWKKVPGKRNHMKANMEAGAHGHVYLFVHVSVRAKERQKQALQNKARKPRASVTSIKPTKSQICLPACQYKKCTVEA